MTMDDVSKLTEEEEQLYDRQIRLWGMDAQNRLRNAKVLIVGVAGVACEVVKNLVLAGISTIGLADELNVTESDISTNFLIARSSLGANRAEAARARTENLNPRVVVNVYNHLPAEISAAGGDNRLSIDAFDIVVSCLSSSPSQRPGECLWTALDAACRSRNKQFFAMDSFGWHGLTFVDLGEHDYLREQRDSPAAADASAGPAAAKWVPEKKSFCSFVDALAIDWSGDRATRRLRRMPKLQFALIAAQRFASEHRRYAEGETDVALMADCWRRFADEHSLPHELVEADALRECVGVGAVPVNAVLGGLVTQEIIKAISGKNEPVGNFVLFNGVACSADSTFTTPTE